MFVFAYIAPYCLVLNLTVQYYPLREFYFWFPALTSFTKPYTCGWALATVSAFSSIVILPCILPFCLCKVCVSFLLFTDYACPRFTTPYAYACVRRFMISLMFFKSFFTEPFQTFVAFIWSTILYSYLYTLYAIPSFIVFVPFTKMIIMFRFVYKTTRAIFFGHVLLFESRPIYVFSAPDFHGQRAKQRILFFNLLIAWKQYLRFLIDPSACQVRLTRTKLACLKFTLDVNILAADEPKVPRS